VEECCSEGVKNNVGGVWDHILNNLDGKENPFAMWYELKNLIYTISDNKNLVLKDKL